MIPEAFEYFAPSSTQEAVSLAQRYGSDAKFLSGGHSLLPMMKLRLAAPRYVIDLGGIGELSGIREEDGGLKIGALVTHHAIERSDLVRKRCSLLAETAETIGDPQVRNRGTIGGSIAHADPAADYPATLLALDVEMEIAGTSGRRVVRAEEFFVGLFSTALSEGEILVGIRVTALNARAGSAYQKLRQQASGFAIAGVAAVVEKDEGGKFQRVCLALTGIGPKAFRARQVEKFLSGKTASERNIAAACRQVAGGIPDVLSDIHASAEYRRAMADVFARRALLAAVRRAEPQ